MSDLDKELEQAVAAIEEPIPAATRPVTPEPAPRKTRGNLGLLIGLLVMGGGILTLVFTSFKGSAVYSKGVDDLVRDKDKFADRAVRVEGTLVKGSLVRRDQPCEYRFTIEKNKVALPVHYSQCVVPDTFRDMPGMDVSVTAEGKLASGYFEASTIMAKCPSKYEMKDRARNGEQAPHAAMTQAL
ncbi:MAG TPA: cytochrome c maturation protein CcmE [Polyangiaceae bacterium]|jgi:cytochrome c-type biogenesis protein CcmE|nr:cytochrome c maturation protein CcmE [Polyangiaceae bacterium]